MFSIMNTLCESRVVPSKQDISKKSLREWCERAIMYLCALRIVFHDEDHQTWARDYAAKTLLRGKSFEKWSSSGNDLYALLHILDAGDECGEYWKGITFRRTDIANWLMALSRTQEGRVVVSRIFTRLNSDLDVTDGAINSIRRIVLDWENTDRYQRKLVMTRLLQMFRSRMPLAQILPKLEKIADEDNLELKHVGNPEGLKENATSGSTSSGAVATVVGTIGAGFDDDYSKSIYPPPKKRPAVIRRAPIDK